MENTNKIAKNSVFYLMAMIIPNIAGFFVLPIYTRFISPEEYGIYYLTNSIIGVMAVLSSMGINVFYLRSYEAENDKKELNGTIYWSMAIWNVALFFMALIITQLIIKTLKISLPFFPHMFLAILTQLFNSMEIIPMRTYRIRGEAKYYFYRIIAKTTINVVLGLYFVISLKLGVLGRYYAELINAFVFAIFFIIYMYRNSYFKINVDLLKRGVKFSLPIIPADLIEMSTPMLINLIIERTLSFSQLGIYSVGVTISSVINIAGQSVFLSFEPVLYAMANSKGYPQFFKKTKDTTLVAVSIICVGAGLFVREAAILLLSEKYWNAWSIVQVISISFIFLALKNMYGLLLLVEGKTKYLVWGNIGYLSVSVIVNIIGISIWGDKSLGWSNLLGWFAAFLTLYIWADKKKYGIMNLKRDFVMISFALLTLYLSRHLHSQPIIFCILLKINVYAAYIFIVMSMYKIYPRLLYKSINKRIIKSYKSNGG